MAQPSVHFLNKNFSWLIYVFAAFCAACLLSSARGEGLLPMPVPGTDQLSMLQAAADIYRGKLPDSGYMYSPIYTLFLFFICALSQGNLVIMRLLQALLCALIPVVIYRLSIRLRFGRSAAQIAALLYCFYGPALLISLDFLREAPLALTFLLLVFYLVYGFSRKSILGYCTAGLFAGLCILGRENFIPIVFAPALLLLLPELRKYVKWQFITGFAVTAAAVLLPVLLYNFVKFGQFAIVPGHVVNVLGAYHGDAAVQNSTLAFISILNNIPVQLSNFLGSYEIPNSLSYYAHRDIIDFFKVFLIPFNLLVALAAVAMAYNFRRHGTMLLVLMLIIYAVTMMFFNFFYRFRIPAIPLFCILAGAGAAYIINCFNNRSINAAIAAVVLAAAAFTACWRDVDTLRPVSERRSVTVLLIDNGHYLAAENTLMKLRWLGAPTPELERRLIAALIKSGEMERANELARRWFPAKPTK
jgi:4-amino-4-deoxy-L-arabinose transferase-like glycosyltransferase